MTGTSVTGAGVPHVAISSFRRISHQTSACPQLELKYHSVADASERLGPVPIIRKLSLDFQGHLYGGREWRNPFALSAF